MNSAIALIIAVAGAMVLGFATIMWLMIWDGNRN